MTPADMRDALLRELDRHERHWAADEIDAIIAAARQETITDIRGEVERHRLEFPPHPDGFWMSSALCLCGTFQWDAPTPETLDRDACWSDWWDHVIARFSRGARWTPRDRGIPEFQPAAPTPEAVALLALAIEREHSLPILRGIDSTEAWAQEKAERILTYPPLAAALETDAIIRAEVERLTAALRVLRIQQVHGVLSPGWVCRVIDAALRPPDGTCACQTTMRHFEGCPDRSPRAS